MRSDLILLLTVLSLLSGAALPAQSDTQTTQQRYILHLRERSFDLSAWRQAVLDGRSAQEVEKILAGYEEKVLQDQASLVRRIEKLSGQVVAQWWIINACAVELGDEAVAVVSRWPEVETVEKDRIIAPARSLPTAWIKTATNSKNHNADSLHILKIAGRGVTTAIMDTGQDVDMGGTKRPHRLYYVNGDPRNKTGGGLGGSRLLINRKIGLLSAGDTTGHGTCVTSVAAGGSWSSLNADRGHAYDAKIAGYGIADAAGGGSSYTTMVSAWQAIAADRVKLGIVTVNMSYAGSPSPLNAAQKALDSAAYNGDLLVAVAAGNNGTNTSFSQSCVNGLSVGAVAADTRQLASFSCRGTPDGQLYPDICANGVNIVMAQMDLEMQDRIWSGTSFASPQVCGAATQLRAAVPTLRANEVKAILLATTAKTPLTGNTQVSTGPGCGYLKNDDAYASATRPARHGRVHLSAATPIARFTLPVQKGQDYQVALAWHRSIVNASVWSNIDLQVKDGSRVVIVSNTLRNSEEFVRFQATKTDNYVIEIVATSLLATVQEVAWATNSDVSPGSPGEVELYGAACTGSRQLVSPSAAVLPKALATSFGNASSYLGFARGYMRYQQILSASEAPVAMSVSGYSLRQDDVATGTTGGAQSYQVLLGYTRHTPATLTAGFASNFNSSDKPVQVFAGTVQIPTWTGSNTNASRFGFSVKFAKPWIYVQRPGENLLIDIQNNSTTSILQFADAVSGLSTTTRLYSFTLASSTGTVARNSGLVIRLDSLGGNIAVPPQLSAPGLPALGQAFRLDLALAPGSTAAALLLGSSRTQWASIPLPWSLAGLGGQGCSLLTSIDLVQGLATDTAGAASLPFAIPSDKGLRGLRFYNQFLVIDPAANRLGMTFTQAARATIGG